MIENPETLTRLLTCDDENCRIKRLQRDHQQLPVRKTTTTMELEETSRNMKKFMLILNCVVLAIGISCGPLVMRLYYLHGGKSIWLSSWLETGGWPIMIVPLLVAYFRRRAVDRSCKPVFITPLVALYAALVGLVAGAGDYCYAYGVKHIPVSTSSLILATQLAFTAGFAFILVKQKFTAFTVNAVALLTFGAIVLALHVSSDKPEGESSGQYYLGFFFTLASSALFAVMLPLIELSYKKARERVVDLNYSFVMEFQLVLSLSATAMCTVGMFASGDYKTYAQEIQEYKLGNAMFFVVLISSAILWQCFYLGAAGVIHYGSSLLSGIIIAVALPVTEIMAIIFYHEKFQVEKGVSLVLSLWGFLSYFYGEAKANKKRKKKSNLQLGSESV
ncbi:purine permease 3-like [Silene latifolia]|uniref:purine permease 3-like n=1 Tax=Silene latifolia TaxID=37657 RepID=UPI003D7707C3